MRVWNARRADNSLAFTRNLNVFYLILFFVWFFGLHCPSMPAALCDEWIVNEQDVHSQINCHYISFVMPLCSVRVCRTRCRYCVRWGIYCVVLAYCMHPIASHWHNTASYRTTTTRQQQKEEAIHEHKVNHFTRHSGDVRFTFHSIDDCVLMAHLLPLVARFAVMCAKL